MTIHFNITGVGLLQEDPGAWTGQKDCQIIYRRVQIVGTETGDCFGGEKAGSRTLEQTQEKCFRRHARARDHAKAFQSSIAVG